MREGFSGLNSNLQRFFPKILLSAQHLEALLDAQTWIDNPFVSREARRDAKRKQPLRSFAWMCGTLLVLGGLAMWGLAWLYREGDTIPWYLSGELGTLLCIVLSGIHIWFIVGAAQKHTTLLLTQEAFRNTLPSLLMLPATPFQLVLQTAVYPWLAAMRMAVVLLPVYVFLVGLGGLSWIDLGMLYVVFGLAAVSFPAWRRPELGDNSVKVLPSTARMGTAGAGTGTQTGAGGATTGAGSGTSSPGGWLAMAFLLPILALVSSGRGGIRGMYALLRHYMPDSIIVLLPTSLLSWPLLMARALITPFDWFGMPVPPLPIVLVLFLLGRYVQVVRAAEFLSVGVYRDLPLQPTYLPRRKLEGTLRILGLLTVTGYLWRWAIWDGGLAWLVNPMGSGAAPGLGGFLYLLLFVTVWRGLLRSGTLGSWLRIGRPASDEVTVRRVTHRSAILFLAEPFLFATLFYLACCLLSRTPPFPGAVAALAGRMLAIGLAGMALSFGARRALGFLTALWVVILLPVLGFGPPEAHRIILLSPTLGLVQLSRVWQIPFPGLFQPAFAWWMWPLDGGLAGLFLSLCGLLMPVRKRREAADAVPAYDPTQVGEEVFSDAVSVRTLTAARTDSPLTQRLIGWVQGISDNPVTTKEMRVRLRGKLQPRAVQMLFGFYLLASLALTQGVPMVADAFGSGLAMLLYGTAVPPAAQPAANTLACFSMVELFLAMFAGFGLLLSFAAEREKSTLGFLLTTPMRSRSIVLGKLAGVLLASLPMMGTLILWTLMLSVLVLPSVGVISLMAWIEVTLTAVIISVTIGMILLAVASLFPRGITLVGGSVLGWIFIQVFFQGVIHASRALRYLITSGIVPAGLEGYGLWLAFLAVCLLLTALAMLFAIWGVRRMRKGDVAFAASKQEN